MTLFQAALAELQPRDRDKFKQNRIFTADAWLRFAGSCQTLAVKAFKCARAHTRFPRVYGVIDQISANDKRGEALIGKQVTTALYNKLPLPNVLEVLERKNLAGHVFRFNFELN